MSRPYDVGDYRLPEQVREDLFPDHDQFGYPWPEDETTWTPITRLHLFPIVFDVMAVGTSASVDTRTPDTPNRVPSPRGSLASPVSDVEAPAGSRCRRP